MRTMGTTPREEQPWYGAVPGVATGLRSGALPGAVAGNALEQSLVLVGLDAISKAVGAGQGAVKRWIRDEGFPARRCSDGTYRADPEAVRRWFGGSAL